MSVFQKSSIAIGILVLFFLLGTLVHADEGGDPNYLGKVCLQEKDKPHLVYGAHLYKTNDSFTGWGLGHNFKFPKTHYCFFQPLQIFGWYNDRTFLAEFSIAVFGSHWECPNRSLRFSADYNPGGSVHGYEQQGTRYRYVELEGVPCRDND